MTGTTKDHKGCLSADVEGVFLFVHMTNLDLAF